MLDAEQINHLRLKAAHRHLTMSALIRELVDKDRSNDLRAERRRSLLDADP